MIYLFMVISIIVFYALMHKFNGFWYLYNTFLYLKEKKYFRDLHIEPSYNKGISKNHYNLFNHHDVLLSKWKMFLTTKYFYLYFKKYEDLNDKYHHGITNILDLFKNKKVFVSETNKESLEKILKNMLSFGCKPLNQKNWSIRHYSLAMLIAHALNNKTQHKKARNKLMKSLYQSISNDGTFLEMYHYLQYSDIYLHLFFDEDFNLFQQLEHKNKDSVLIKRITNNIALLEKSILNDNTLPGPDVYNQRMNADHFLKESYWKRIELFKTKYSSFREKINERIPICKAYSIVGGERYKEIFWDFSNSLFVNYYMLTHKKVRRMIKKDQIEVIHF